MAIEAYPSRVRFFDGQFLQAQDLTDEQSFHILMRWRHNLALHSWGIVSGLEVAIQKGASGLFLASVQPGMAFDGYGRELILASVALTASLTDPNATYDVLITYGLPLSSSPTSDSSSYGCPTTQQSNRAIEQPTVWVTKTSSRISSDPSAPGEVPTGDLDFTADQVPPDDPTQQWPVLLGRLSFQTQSGTWVVDNSVRRYAGLIADRIASPAPSNATTPVASSAMCAQTPPQRTIVQTGSDPVLSQYRFAVLTAGLNETADPDANPPFFAIRELPPASASAAPGHQIEFRTERVEVAADMVFQNGSVLQFQTNPVGAEDEHKTPVNGSAQWRMYHHFEPPPPLTPPPASTTPTGGSTAQSPPPSPGFSDELRITIPASTTPATTSLSIGCYDDKGQFNPILVVNGDKSVVVYGNLSVQGIITQGLITDAPGNQSAAAPPPTPSNILVQAVGAFLNGSATDQNSFLTSVYINAAVGRAAINTFIATSATADDITALAPAIAANATATSIALFAPALWSATDTSKALGSAVVPPTAPPPGATADRFTSFLNALPVQLADATPTKTVKVIGDWLFSLTGNDATKNSASSISAIDFSIAKDDAITAFAKGITTGLPGTTPPALKTLIKQLIANGAATEMIAQLQAGHAQDMVKSLLGDATQLSTVIPAFVNGLFPTTIVTPPSASDFTNLKLMVATMLDNSWTASATQADIDPTHNLGTIAIALALDQDLPAITMPPPSPPTPAFTIPPTARLCRFLTYVLDGGDATLFKFKQYFQFYSSGTKLPPHA